MPEGLQIYLSIAVAVAFVGAVSAFIFDSNGERVEAMRMARVALLCLVWPLIIILVLKMVVAWLIKTARGDQEELEKMPELVVAEEDDEGNW